MKGSSIGRWAKCPQIITFFLKRLGLFHFWNWITKTQEPVILTVTSFTNVMVCPALVIVLADDFPSCWNMLCFCPFLNPYDYLNWPSIFLKLPNFNDIILNENRGTSELLYLLFINCPLSHSLKRISYTWKLKFNAMTSLIKQICVSQVHHDPINV